MILGFTGYAQSGKDTAARVLLDAPGSEWERRAVGDRILRVLRGYNPFLPRFGCRLVHALDSIGVPWDELKRYPEVRESMLAIADANRDVMGADCWINAAFRAPVRGSLIVTDIRRNVEAGAIWDRGGHIIRVVRPGVVPLAGDDEVDAITPDAVIENDGPLRDLAMRVREVVEGLAHLTR